MSKLNMLYDIINLLSIPTLMEVMEYEADLLSSVADGKNQNIEIKDMDEMPDRG